MNREQQKILELLKEIDTICRKNKITYFLSPYFTLCAVTGRPFPQNPTAGNVYMKTGDMERFKNAFEEEPELRRTLESMDNNKRFPGFFLRYTDKDTLYYTMDNYGRYQYPGMAVKIVPLQCEYGPKKKYMWNRMREDGWKKIRGKNGQWKTKRDFACIWMVRFLSLCGRGWLAKSIFRDLIHQPQKNVQTYVIRFQNQNIYYPAYIFENPQEVELEGERFFVPGDTDKYLTIAFGKNYADKAPENYRPAPTTICSALIPCEEFMQQYGGEAKKLAAERKRREARRKYGMNYKQYFNQCWTYAKFCGTKYTCARAYRKKTGYIRNLYKNQDYVQLENIFSEYTGMMNKCLKYDEIFEADPEILDIYMNYLEKTGRTPLLEKVKEMGVNIAHVTLHVGLGTFRPVKVDDVEKHHMHSEFYIVEEDQAKLINDTKKNGGRVISVGTTSCRTLESATGEDGIVKAGSGWTEIFIYPGYKFKAIDGLITNFHLPESTLLMLVSALAGKEHIMAAYEEAGEERYRFFSFGDAMMIE